MNEKLLGDKGKSIWGVWGPAVLVEGTTTRETTY